MILLCQNSEFKINLVEVNESNWLAILKTEMSVN